MENRKALYATSGLKSGFITYDNSVKENYYSSEERKERINTATDTLILFTNVAYKISLCFCAIMLIFMLIQFTKLGAAGDNEMARKKAIAGILTTGIATALLGGATIVVGFFWNVISNTQKT